jgi:hypothetical protein
MTSIPDNVVLTHRDNLRGLVEKAESLIPELLERGRAPNGSFPPLESLGYVELDRGEDDLRPFVSQTLSSVLDVVTDEECTAGCYDSREPISVGALLDRLDWCVASDPVVAKRFPEWSQLDELQRLEAVCHFVGETLQDYRLRLLEVADTEEVVLDPSGLPSYEEPIHDLRLLGHLLVINDAEIEVTRENAGDIRDWLFAVMCCQGSKLTESQQTHVVEALQRTDSLCPVSMSQWIP